MLNCEIPVRRQPRTARPSARSHAVLPLPTEDEIRRRAHEIFLSRNGKPGNAVLDWLEAEQELRAARQLGAGVI